MSPNVREKRVRPSVVITAGPTREEIDPIRFISNYSTGRFGYEIAREAVRRGCPTTLISGPTALTPPKGARTTLVGSAIQMKSALDKARRGADVIIMAAAVSDWRVRNRSGRKLKRNGSALTIELIENPDIISSIARKRSRRQLLVGFALETEALKANALKKLEKKGLDIIVANLTGEGEGPFGDNIIDIMILDRRGGRQNIRGKTKRQAAKIILDKVFGFNI